MSQATLFISDLHLDSSRPDITQLFLSFLAQEAATADALYILGDLFEFWIGDDDTRPDYQPVIQGLRQLTDSGVTAYFMHGNRDFLAGKLFAKQTGCTLLEDPSVIDLYGEQVLLMHGDTLCTDDTAYQAFRAEVRSARWQNRILGMSLEERIAYFQTLREASQESIRKKPAAIMDVNQHTVETLMLDARITRLIHGHTHRPGMHNFTLHGKPAMRIVLGDWYTQGSVLVATANDLRLEKREVIAGTVPAR